MKQTKTLALAGVAMAAALAHSDPAAAIGQKDEGGAGSDDAVKLIKELGDGLSAKFSKLEEDFDRLKNTTGEDPKAFADFKSQVDERFTEFNGIKQQLTDIEQKLARGLGSGPEPVKSIGQEFVESEGLKALAANKTSGGRVSLQFERSIGQKDISSVNSPGDTPGSAGALVVEDRRGLVDLPRRRMTVRGLLSQSQTNSNVIEYEALIADTNAAASVAEGAAIPQTELTFEDRSAPVVDIGHMIRANRNILDDAPRLRSVADGRLIYGLAYKEELQLLLGDGSSGSLTGLVTAASAYSAPVGLPTGTVTKIDVLRLAMLQTVVAEYAASGIVLNHIDWATIELQKDSQGRYIIGFPQGQIGATLWGLPVSPTNAMTEDEFLVGDFEMGAELVDRMQSTIEASTEDRDNFQKRKVSIAAYERLALPIYNPSSFVTGDFSTILAAANP